MSSEVDVDDVEPVAIFATVALVVVSVDVVHVAVALKHFVLAKVIAVVELMVDIAAV